MMIKETATERAAVREFWAFLEAELAKQPRKACHLPQLVAVLIDDYRYLAPLILLDAQQDPVLQARLARAEAVSVAAPLRWEDGVRATNAPIERAPFF